MMTMNVIVTADVPLGQDAAFHLFVDELESWWPQEYTWSGDVLQRMAIEPYVNGSCYEIGPHGFRCDWGRVLAFEPPRALVFSWQISPSRAPEPNDARASEVSVRFEPIGSGATRVTIDHRGFERHGNGSDEYRDAMGSDRGWPHILDRFAERCSA